LKKSGRKKAFLITASVPVVAAGVFFALSGIKKSTSYKKAVEIAGQNPAEAYEIFTELKGYKDSEEQAQKLAKEDPALPYRNLKKGNVLTFGTYEQDNDASDGTEPIEWLVLDKIGDEILLISISCIDCVTYNDVAFEPVTWADCSLRKWLNGEFYETAFSADEKKLIALTENVNPDQATLGTEGGADTEDYVYLLCEKEAGIYMGNSINKEYAGMAYATAYAIYKGAFADENGLTEWWLRTPGAYEYTAQYVESSGSVYEAGAYVDLAYGIRPVIRIKI